MTNPIIDRARLHFRADEVRRIEVAEWGDDSGPLIIHAAPVTLADKAKLGARFKDGGLQEMYVYCLIMKAKDAAGNAIFTLEDKRALMTSVAPAVVERIAGEILLSASVEDAEKN